MQCRRMMMYLKSGFVSRLLLLLYDLTTVVVITSSRSPITDCVHPTTVLSLAGQSRIAHIYYCIYACAGTEERKTRSWPLKAVRLLNPTVGVSRLLTRAFSLPPGPPELSASFPVVPPKRRRVPSIETVASGSVGEGA